MVQKINEFYYFDEYTSIEEPIISFDDSLIHYDIQPYNKLNRVHVNRQADLIFKKGDYLHTYITIDSTGIPDDMVFNLVDENENQLYSPFTPDGEYEKYKCFVKVNEVDVIPLPADYSSFNTWIDFEPGIYHWKLKSEEQELYDSITIDIQVEIRGFNVWEPIQNIIYPDESVIYKLRTYADIIPSSTDLLTEHATYENGIITYPPSDLNTTPGEHYQQVGNRYIYYVVEEERYCLTDMHIDNNGDLDCTTQSTKNITDLSTFVNSIGIDIEDLDIDIDAGEGNYGIISLKLDNNGDLTFDIIELGDET